MLPSSLVSLLWLLQLAWAFVPLTPSYINNKKKFSVWSKQKPPKGYKETAGLISKKIQKDAAVSTNDGSFTLSTGISFIFSDADEYAYYVNAGIGSSDFPLLIDTGSAYLWVYDSECNDDSCSDKPLYSASSSGSSSSSKTFDLSYNTGTASGIIVQDDVTIANVEAESFSFGAASVVPDLFQDYPFSGILGLSAGNESSSNLINIVDYLYKNGTIDAAKFALCMSNYVVDDSLQAYGNNSGLLILGSDQPDLYIDPIYSTDILTDSSNHWEVKIDKIFVDDYQLQFQALKIPDYGSSNISRIGLLDSGTTSIILSSKDAITLHSCFANSESDGTQYAIYCNTTSVVSLDIAGHNWTITSDQYLGTAYSEDSGLSGYCVSNFQGLDSTTDGSWILGNIFLKSYYVEFDYANAKVGFAERADNVVVTKGSQDSLAITSSGAESSAGSSAFSSTACTSYFNSSSSTLTSSSANASSTSSNSTSSTSDSKASAAPLLPSFFLLSIMLASYLI
ncbi:hypothetical protein FOA43_000853 [Brettanomyces nanus]|uniref:Peptidase A1 domain-containing protein n=1 Tax=Eeniella nana TaxID=13502 RepID=A0A875RWD3_EENNA|nr:uncharacterized protein FOA43_000853 [Brettanomyces nanus]QPG73541.1 hypothetical protein FOA43_000853 [Brettanomyces nanus]